MKEQPSSSILMIPDRQRQSFMFEPPDDRHRRSPTEKKKKMSCCHLSGWRRLFRSGTERKGIGFSLITELLKSFGAPPAAASSSCVSKCCARYGARLRTTLTLSRCDLWSLCCPDTLERFGAQNLFFFPPFLFPLFLELEERIDITRCIRDCFFSVDQVELAPSPSERFSPTLVSAHGHLLILFLWFLLFPCISDIK